MCARLLSAWLIPEPDLTRGVVYELMPDKKAGSHGYVRVVDDSGEDYLYPAAMFLRLRLKHASQRAFVRHFSRS